jgi:uncharacterized damage-inducible protein DinB
VASDDPLVETWQINARINRYLLDALPEASLEVKAPSGGRTVGETFAHLHNVRLMWLQASAPEVLAGLALEKIEKTEAHSPVILVRGLDASTSAIVELVTRARTSGGRLKGFKPHVHAFVGYLVSHESHHRGQIVLALKIAGVAVDKKVSFGLWEWGRR